MIVLPNKSAAVWDRFLKENEALVYKYIVREIKKHLESDTERIELFKFEDDTMFAWVLRKEILKTLTHALTMFVKKEEYEYARKTDSIIKQYHINKLINETKQFEE
jgi:succinate dehydrogenase flavin-adding protein (antitoxin of CptAB toxin-antitoxin module)